MSLPRNVIIQYIEVPAPPGDTPGPFSLSDRGALEQALAQAGWSSVHSEPLELASASDYTRFIQAISPSINALLASQSAEQQERIWQAIRETVQERYGSADGTLRMIRSKGAGSRAQTMEISGHFAPC